MADNVCISALMNLRRSVLWRFSHEEISYTSLFTDTHTEMQPEPSFCCGGSL